MEQRKKIADRLFVTVFPGETVEILGTIRKNTPARWVRVEGYNTPVISVLVK